MKSDLELKRDLLTAVESNLAKTVQCNDQISDSFHKCDVDLSRYSELVNQMSDRWRRIQTQIDSRYSQIIWICAHFLKYPHILHSSLLVTTLKITVHSFLRLPLLPLAECGT